VAERFGIGAVPTRPEKPGCRQAGRSTSNEMLHPRILGLRHGPRFLDFSWARVGWLFWTEHLRRPGGPSRRPRRSRGDRAGEAAARCPSRRSRAAAAVMTAAALESDPQTTEAIKSTPHTAGCSSSTWLPSRETRDPSRTPTAARGHLAQLRVLEVVGLQLAAEEGHFGYIRVAAGGGGLALQRVVAEAGGNRTHRSRG
jgi:hypothetical protein